MATSGHSVRETPTKLALLIKVHLQGLGITVRVIMTVSLKRSYDFGLQCGNTYRVQILDDSKGANTIVTILQSYQYRLTFC